MKYIAYYRVSTAKQGKSGLGLDAQSRTVQDFIKGDKRRDLIASYKEVESGKNDVRTELNKAIDHCKKVGATLLIAKLDRLSRNVGFIFMLRDSKVDFQALDLPDANTLTIGIFAVVAQHEREIISKRIREALAAKKARGFTLGTPANLTKKVIKKGLQTRVENSKNNPNNRKAFEVIEQRRKQGYTFQQIADKLNDLGFKTRREKKFFPASVQALYNRFPTI
jgi:DNA invertase Pin-like site-specific DNA recombinase